MAARQAARGTLVGQTFRVRDPVTAGDLALVPFRAGHGTALAGRRSVYGADFQQLMHGVHGSAREAINHGLLVQAMRAKLGPEPVLVGASAAWALGSRLNDPDQAVHVVVVNGSGVRRQPLLVAHRVSLDPSVVIRTSLGPATSAARTALDMARGFGGGPATHDMRVAHVDALLRVTSLAADDARTFAAAAKGLWRLADARRVLDTVRDGVDSVKESELRLLLARQGIEEPVVQCPVRIDGPGTRIIARLDLGWPHHRVGVEYDGRVHLELHQHSRDLVRHNLIRAAGWTVLQVDARGLRRPEPILAQLRALLADSDFRRDRAR